MRLSLARSLDFMSRSLGTYSMKMAKSGPWNRMKIKLLFDYHSLILLVEDAYLIFPTTFIVKKSKSMGTSVYWPWIIREAIVLRRKWRLRAQGSVRVQKECYLGGPWDKSDPPCHSRWNRFRMTCSTGYLLSPSFITRGRMGASKAAHFDEKLFILIGHYSTVWHRI